MKRLFDDLYFKVSSDGLELKAPGFFFMTENKEWPLEFGWFTLEMDVPFVGSIDMSYLPGDGWAWFLQDKGIIKKNLILLDVRENTMQAFLSKD